MDVGKNIINRLNIGFTLEFLQFFDFSLIFPIRLELKINVSIILLRNMFSKKNLYNEIRMIITKFDRYIIKTKILIRKFANII